MKLPLRRRAAHLVLALPLLVYAGVALEKAWVSDDAYIAFRTVDNIVHGHGPTWNPGERVQAYTHPLWMLLVSALHAVTHEMFFTSILLSLAVSLLAVLVLVLRLARGPHLALLGAA